ncbi:MAG: DUF2789 family protein [Pseudomonadales bacterium]|nr:DUF2789 family protein [Pseudomonadales bacterium]
MQPLVIKLDTLFQQLGLSTKDQTIDDAISNFPTLDPNLAIYDAPFWDSSQAEFLKSAIQEDSIWSHAVEKLDCLLRK